MADRDPPGYDDWFDDPEPPTIESGRGNRPSYDIPADTEEDVWVLPEDEARRARRGGGRRGDLVVGGRLLTSTQVAIIAIAGLAIVIAILAAAGAFSSGTPSATLPTTPSHSTTTSTTTTTTPTVALPTELPLQLNDTGEQVKLLQKALRSLGFLSDKADGVFGAATQSAVEHFQTAHRLTADGVVGKDTVTALREQLLGG